MVEDPRSNILQVEEKKKHYTGRGVKRADCARRFQHITRKSVNLILHIFYNNILQNFPILQEDIGMAEDIYGPSVTHLQIKTVRQKLQYADPIVVKKFPKVIIYR